MYSERTCLLKGKKGKKEKKEKKKGGGHMKYNKTVPSPEHNLSALTGQTNPSIILKAMPPILPI